MASGEQSSSPWDAWMTSELDSMKSRRLLRMQRPTVAMCSSAQALIHPDDLEAWASGAEQPTCVRTWQQQHGSTSGSSSGSSNTTATTTAGSSGSSSSDSVPLRPITLFSLNDYLGLASHPDVCAAAAAAASKLGMGPRSSAVVGGTTHMHRELEEALATLKGAEDCLLFPTGFAANMATVSALCSASSGSSSSGDGSSSSSSSVAVFSDELNHASIIDGTRLASRGGASVHVYRHNDLQHLEQLLCSVPPGTRKLVVTDSLFSMDGDFADLQGLARLRQRYGFLLAVDEAHATLVCGPHGGGVAEALGLEHQVDLHVGTLSKAVGSLGGFVATSRALKQLLLNRGRSYVYSTALPLPVVAAAQASITVSHREPWRRAHVWSLTRHLAARLGNLPALSPIVPLVVGGEEESLALASRMLRTGMHVPAIRPPTVPPGTCRLRVSLSAAHSLADVDSLADAVLASGVALQRLPHLEDPRQIATAAACARAACSL